ncbi:unnamed protein product [Phytophthora lilii]|uniref:Unnamed protein product n=1 Tax=Phytophthora lilii TaxID=2077276 RepID=A0A9W6TRD6_9STRA|nr:unnamed protein product [Phytophthora lilii]
MRREELPSEAAAVAAFLSDISGFLEDEVDTSSSSSVHQHDHLTHSVHDETLGTVRGEEQGQRPAPDDEAQRKRLLRNIKTGKRRDAYRKRLKEEWQTLRCEEVELAARLEEIQQSRRKDNGGMARSAWRAIAMRPLKGRKDAEAQQERLKAAVKRRRELIQDVENSLRKRLREVEEASKAPEGSIYFDKRDWTQPADERLFEAYLEELDTIYAKTDNVFQSCETSPTKGPFLSTMPPTKRDGDTEYFENVGVLHVPFEFKRTCLALWEVTRQPYRQLDREEYSGVVDIENTIAVRFRVKCRLHTGGIVSLLTHFVSRRYVEETRTVIIWRELWEGEGDFFGMDSDETGWCIVQPCEDTAENATPSKSCDRTGLPSTLIQTCVRLVPMHISTCVSSKPDFDQFTEVLVTSGKEDNRQVGQMMERLQLGLAQVTLRSTYSTGSN